MWNKCLSPGSQPPSSNTRNKRSQKEDAEAHLEIHEPQKGVSHVDETEISHKRMVELENWFRQKECGWIAREKDLQTQIYQAKQYAAERDRTSQAKFNELQSEKASLEAQHIAFIRKQQEESFKQMESARWIPEDESRVRTKLDKLKRDMRAWAKTSSIKIISVLDALKEPESVALMEQLSHVVFLEDGRLPKCISNTTKSPMLLLNALLTHHVYTNLFQSPFFFVQEAFGDYSSSSLPGSVLGEIYERAKRGKLILSAGLSLSNFFSEPARCSYMAFPNFETHKPSSRT